MNPRHAAPIVAAALLTTACSAPADTATATADPTPVTPQTYGTLTDLRDAATAAGHPCPSWTQDNAVVR